MSAEALRAFTTEKVNTEIGDYARDLVEKSAAPLDEMRFAQGFIAGLKRGLELQNEAYRVMGA